MEESIIQMADQPTFPPHTWDWRWFRRFQRCGRKVVWKGGQTCLVLTAAGCICRQRWKEANDRIQEFSQNKDWITTKILLWFFGLNGIKAFKQNKRTMMMMVMMLMMTTMMAVMMMMTTMCSKCSKHTEYYGNEVPHKGWGHHSSQSTPPL